MLMAGDKAPDFHLPADDGGDVSLQALAGHKVVLYFYPKDNTSGCTAEALAFREASADFIQAGVSLFGISRDGVRSHQAFRAKLELPFPLLADEDGAVCQAYGTWVEKSMYGRKYFGIERSTFLIGEDGILRAVWRKVKVPGHAAAVLAAALAEGN